MKFRIRWRIVLPYVILLCAQAIIFASVLPPILRHAYQEALVNEQSPNLTTFYLVTIILVILAIVTVLLLSLYVSTQTLGPLEKLTRAAKQMGAGQFDEIDIPKPSGEIIEIKELSEALRQTVEQISAQINALTNERSKLAAVLSQMTDGVLIADSGGHV